MPHCTGDIIDEAAIKNMIIWGDGVVGAVLCLIGATLYRRYGEMV